MIVILVCATFFMLGAHASDMVVKIDDGAVLGIEYQTPTGAIFRSWRGIPYAKPPVGELRFLPPQKPEPWEGILNATVSGPACIFVYSFPNDPLPVSGNSEDCLTTNVYAPRLPSNDPSGYPVMFWIHGGGYASGTGDFNFFDPTPFLVDGVIVVTCNYRLGAFGFLSTGDSVLPGNTGLKDQLLALKWAKDNVAYFGGNPNKITIFGESAGAMSVGNHLVSPKTKGLYVGAILQSGTALTYIDAATSETVYSIAQSFNSSITNSSSSSEVIKVLQSIEAETLRDACSVYSFAPIVEVETDEAFITEPRYELLASGRYNQVPVIVGHNLEEAITFLPSRAILEQTAASMDSDPTTILPYMSFKNGVDKTEVGKKIHDKYAGENANFSDNLAAVLNWKSDDMFLRSCYKDAMFQSKYSTVYMYQLSFYGTTSQSHEEIPGAGNVGHADDLAYLFNVSTIPLQTEADFLTRSKMVKLWTNFAKYQNPIPDDESSDILAGVKWEPATPDTINLLDIGDELQMKPYRKAEVMTFWDNIWETYADRPYDTY